MSTFRVWGFSKKVNADRCAELLAPNAMGLRVVFNIGDNAHELMADDPIDDRMRGWLQGFACAFARMCPEGEDGA